MVRLPWNNVLEARLFPLVCGIASMFLFRSTARRYLSPGPSRSRPGLFALCRLADLLLVGDQAILVRPDADPDRAPGGRRPDPAIGCAVRPLLTTGGCWRSPASVSSGSGSRIRWPWCSRASGTYLIAWSAGRKAWRQFLGLAATGLAWVSSFAACYVVSHRILSKERFIWDWWDFAFLPIPPRSFAELETRLLADPQRLRQSGRPAHAAGRGPLGIPRAGAVPPGRDGAGAAMARGSVSPRCPPSSSRSRPRRCTSIRSTAGS